MLEIILPVAFVELIIFIDVNSFAMLFAIMHLTYVQWFLSFYDMEIVLLLNIF